MSFHFVISACLFFVLKTEVIAAHTDGQSSQILVGPNILVSRDGEFPHIEYTISANPANANEFIAASMTLSGPGDSIGVRIYASHDGGNTWVFNRFPELERGRGNGSGDPQVGFGPNGTAYFVALTDEFEPDGNEVPQRLYVYRSANAGNTWLPPVRLSTCDRPSLAVDFSKGKFRGRVYISALYTKDHQQKLGLFHSDDDGRSFIGPADVVNATSGAQVSPPLVLSDGTLVFPYVEFETGRSSKFASEHILKVMTSVDGGSTFSAPREIAVQSVPSENLVENLKQRLASRSSEPHVPHLGAVFDWPAIPQFASDPTIKPFHNRIYAVWGDTRSGNQRVLISYSGDHGRSWSSPRSVSPDVPTNSEQCQPMVTVNEAGVVGVQWLDSRDSAEQNSYDLYFTASVDGGKSFLAPRKVTSQPSFPTAEAHTRPNLEDNAGRQNGFELVFASIESTRGVGDYLGLTADSTGLFHPLWADSRNGTFQMWTARLGVWSPRIAKDADPSNVSTLVRPNDVTFFLDPIQYDASKHRVDIPIRLQNISTHELAGPISVVVKSVQLAYPALVAAGFEPPRILNATNRRPGSGAIFDYSTALGDFRALDPGQLSEAITWEFELKDPGQALFSIQAEVSGGVAQ